MPILDMTFIRPLPIALMKCLTSPAVSCRRPVLAGSLASAGRDAPLGAVAGEHREVVHLARRAGLDHQAGAGAQALHQVLVDRRQRQQRRDGDAVGGRLRSETMRML